MNRYFQLRDDISFPARWYLDKIRGQTIDIADNWKFSGLGGAVDGEYTLSLTLDGFEMDFTLTDAFMVPIVSAPLKEALEFVDGVRFIRVKVERKTEREYYAMVTDAVVDCFDESRSVFQVFAPDDPIRPDRAGDYHSVSTLRIDAVKAQSHDIFRIKRYPTALVVSDQVKNVLGSGGFTGLAFTSCS